MFSPIYLLISLKNFRIFYCLTFYKKKQVLGPCFRHKKDYLKRFFGGSWITEPDSIVRSYPISFDPSSMAGGGCFLHAASSTAFQPCGTTLGTLLGGFVFFCGRGNRVKEKNKTKWEKREKYKKKEGKISMVRVFERLVRFDL